MKQLKPTSAKEIYFWNIMGSGINALLSVLLLLAVSLFLNSEDGDTFSIAWSFGMQASTIGLFQVRLYQATDINEVYSFRQYLCIRLITVFFMLVYTIYYVLSKDFSIYKCTVILLVCLSRAVDAFSDLFQGWYQQKQRLDLSGKVMTAHSLVSILIFGISLFLSRNLIFSCIMMLVGHFVVFIVFDYQYFRPMAQIHDPRSRTASDRTLSILLTCFPLFLNGFIIMDIFNSPKYAIDAAISTGSLPDGSQMIYNILFMPAFVLNLAFIALRPMITDLAFSWNSNQVRDFFRRIWNICRLLLLFSLVVLLLGWFLGCPCLSLVYNIPLTGHRSVLMIIIVGGLFNAFMYLLDNVITVIRKHSLLIIAYLITWFYTRIVVNPLVDAYGLLGASASFASSMLLLLLITTVLFCISLFCTLRKKA